MLRPDKPLIDKVTSFVLLIFEKKRKKKDGKLAKEAILKEMVTKKNWQNKILSGIMRKATGGVMLCSCFDGVCGFLLNQAKDTDLFLKARPV